MVFSSNVFLFLFLPITILLYYLAPRAARNCVLFIMSLIFYAWGEPKFTLVMLFIILINYLLGLVIGKKGKPVLILSIILNLGVLVIFKYSGFLWENVSALIPGAQNIRFPQIALPIGISFYIFQSMSYTIDVYRGNTGVQKNLLTFGTYVAMFPQLIAGPIVKYRDVETQLETREESYSMFAEGVGIFLVGLAKKVLIANQMGRMFSLISMEPGTLAAWIAMLGYSLQIYFDFSGYSDMAIGLGKMFGFEFLMNFNYPYISTSITDFWRRWHISLSTWFKEYVYIPLGGNRKGLPRQILNLFVVWSLTGLWHGASWNFILWGVYYAVLLSMEKLFMGRWLEKLPKIVRHLYTLLLVGIGWMIFCFDDMANLTAFLPKLFSFTASSEHALHTILAYLPILLIGVLASTPWATSVVRKHENSSVIRVGKPIFLCLCFLCCIMSLTSGSYNPFIYFRF